MFTTLKGVACVPPDNISLTTKTVAGLKIPDVKSGLKALAVVADVDICPKFGATHWLHQGATIYVANEAVTSPWAKQVCEIGGVKFIIVPLEFVVAFEDAPPINKARVYDPTPVPEFNEPRP